MAAPLGNSNAAKGRRWQDALNKALARCTGPDVEMGQALDKIAEKVVTQALNGDWDSIVEIGNRLDGKAAQGITVSGDPDNPLDLNHTVSFLGAHPAATET